MLGSENGEKVAGHFFWRGLASSRVLTNHFEDSISH